MDPKEERMSVCKKCGTTVFIEECPVCGPTQSTPTPEAEAPTEGRSLASSEIGRLVAELRELEARATPGPWEDHNWDPMERPHVVASCMIAEGDTCRGQADMPRTSDDAALIALFRNNARTLLDKLETLLRVAEAARELVRLKGYTLGFPPFTTTGRKRHGPTCASNWRS
jgi:hypothetical protein